MTGFACHGVGFSYPTSDGRIDALRDVTFSASGHEIVSVVGPSGCGKSTLLKLLAGLLQPTAGSIHYTNGTPGTNGANGTNGSNGHPARGNGAAARGSRSDAARNGDRPRNALVFQDHGVFPWLTVVDNVAFGLEMQGMAVAERRDRARAFLERVGLEDFVHRYPHELSVGMRQRVGIARAFVSDFPILLLDEPFGALDAQTRLLLQEELLDVWQDERKLALFVTHDIEEAILLGDRVLVMSGRPGRILEEIQVPLPRPRGLAAPDRPEVTELKWHIWHHLEKEARRQLSIAG